MDRFLRKTVWFQAAFADLLDVQFTAVTPYKLFESTELSGGTNLGGPLLRSLVIQGNLPDTQSLLAVALTRSGLAQQLRDQNRSSRKSPKCRCSLETRWGGVFATMEYTVPYTGLVLFCAAL